MKRCAGVLLLFFASAVSAQDIGNAAFASDQSGVSIALGWRVGSVTSPYALGDAATGTPGAPLVSLQLGSDRWHLAGESTLLFGGSSTRHAGELRHAFGGRRFPVIASLTYGYASEAMPIFASDDLQIRAQRHTHVMFTSIEAPAVFTGSAMIRIRPVAGMMSTQSSFEAFRGTRYSVSRSNEPFSGTAGLAGFQADVRCPWRALLFSGEVMPVWSFRRSSPELATQEIIFTAGISYFTGRHLGISPNHLGFSLRATHTSARQGITHLGSSAMFSVIIYP